MHTDKRMKRIKVVEKKEKPIFILVNEWDKTFHLFIHVNLSSYFSSKEMSIKKKILLSFIHANEFV